MKGDFMHHKHMRSVGGAQPRKTLTCPDAWPQAWTYATRIHVAPSGNRRPGRDLDGGLQAIAQAITDGQAADLADAVAAGWQPWEVCARFGCDYCAGCLTSGHDECDGQAAA